MFEIYKSDDNEIICINTKVCQNTMISKTYLSKYKTKKEQKKLYNKVERLSVYCINLINNN